MSLEGIAKKIFNLKYSAKKDETWEEACLRVSRHVASAEKLFGKSDEETAKVMGRFYQLLNDRAFLPGGRILANSGRHIKNLMNCFSYPIEDSRDSIYGALRDASEIFNAGGGVGFNFSKIREEGAPISSSMGKAAGPLAFMSLFDQTGEVIQQASRRGAQIGIMNVDHPDIEKFIDFKSVPNSRNERLLDEYHKNLATVNGTLKNTKYYDVLRRTLLEDQLTHFNISVLLSDEFMEAVEKNKDWKLVSRADNSTVRKVKANELFRRISQQAWVSGDPGILFYDAINKDNMVHYLGAIDTTNPCSEVTLLGGESCCLGSINLLAMIKDGQIDWEFFEYVIRNAVRFLDDVQEVSEVRIEKITKITRGLRRLGIGVMGFSDLLAQLNVAYDSQTGRELGNYISWFISFFAWLESMELAKERGVFPLYEAEKADLHVVEKILNSKYNPEKFDMERIRHDGFRNVSVTAIAPTGSIAMLCGVHSAIEPFFALAYKRNITEGVGNQAKDYVIEINPILFNKLIEAGISANHIEAIKEKVMRSGSLQKCDVSQDLKDIFKTANEISWDKHIEMQASWQEYVTNSISKTINCPEDTTEEDMEKMLMLMWKAGLKGGTIYRNNSRNFQILNAGTK
jgi:ribonucleoside-diphosphate reductase alpha chain